MTSRSLTVNTHDRAADKVAGEPSAARNPWDNPYWAAVNVLGGYFDPADERAAGYDAALGDALAAIEKLPDFSAQQKRDRDQSDLVDRLLHDPDRGNTAMCSEAAATITALEAALREIADSHIPSQPATSAGDDLVWAQRHVGRLRGIALAALKSATGEA